MPGRVEEDPEGLARLVLVLHGSEGKNGCFGIIEVIDHDVEVHLLRMLLGRPLGPLVVVDLLEAERLPVLGADLRPVLFDVNGPIEHRAAERGKDYRVGAVEDSGGTPSSGHAAKVPRITDNVGPQASCGTLILPSGYSHERPMDA